MIGQQVEKYRILEEIGHGGMAVVYRAMDTNLKREVAIKILHPHLLRQQEAVERFQREAVTVARLHHSNIIEIYDYSADRSAYRFIVTELIDGMTLGAFVNLYNEIPCELVACIARELCLALAHAHEQGIIHRDLKPENVMIRRDGKVKLMDFGIARALEGSQLTLTGSILGSPAFMSPEHVSGKEADARSDLFSLGCILYLLATDDMPFDGRNPHEVLKKVTEGDYLPPQEIKPVISNEFAAVIDRLLVTDPEKRYQSSRELLKDLNELIANAGIEQPSREVHDLFLDPPDYIERFKKRLAADIEKRAKVLIRRRPAEALRLYGRLLELCPEHPEASRHIDSIRTRREFRRRTAIEIAVGGFLLLLLAAAWTSVRWWTPAVPAASETQETSKTPQASFPPDDLGGLRKTKARKRAGDPQRPKIAANRGRLSAKESKILDSSSVTPRTAKADEPKEEAADFSGTLQVVTRPWADIHVDGRKVGQYPLDANKRFRLKAGRHAIRLENPGFVPYTETVMIDRPNQQVVIRKELKLLPAYLRLVNEQGAMVFIDGRFRGHTPLAEPIQVRWEEQVLKKRILVSLTKEGHKPFNEHITLSAGKTERLELVLDRKN